MFNIENIALEEAERNNVQSEYYDIFVKGFKSGVDKIIEELSYDPAHNEEVDLIMWKLGVD